jgi:transposase-like protein
VAFLLSKGRDADAAKRFFSRAMRQHGAPRVITLDGNAASHRAVAKLQELGTLPQRVCIRCSKYLNNGKIPTWSLPWRSARITTGW